MDDGGFDLDGVDDAFVLSPAQQGMLYHSEAEPGTGVYVGVLDCTLPDNLDEDRFRKAWAHVIKQHDALRSVFVWAGVDSPLQVVRSDCSIAWETPDAPLPETDGLLDRAYVEAVRNEGLDLTQAPAMRFILGHLPSGARSFLWVCHHALVDDWSQALVMQDVQDTYHALGAAQPLERADSVPYGAFAEWLAARDTEADEAFWQSHFSGFTTPTRLQLQQPVRTNATTLRGVAELDLTVEASAALAEMARAQRVTLASAVTAIWGVVLHRLSGEDDCAFGLAVTQRPPELGDMDRAIGNFVTTMPTRMHVNTHATLREMIAQCHDMVQDAQPRSGLSLSRLQQIIGLPQDTPLFDAILSIKQDAMGALDTGPDALFCDPAIQFKSNFPFAMVVMPGDPIRLRVIYNPASFTQDAAETALQMFAAALTATPRALDAPPLSLPVMTEDRSAQAKAGYRADTDPLPEPQPLHSQILQQAAEQPDALAITDANGTLSYGDLRDRATVLAQRLVADGLGAGDRVGLYLHRGSDVPVAMLGCLMAGVAYVPFDPTFPQARTMQMMEAARLSAVVVRGEDLHTTAPTLDLNALTPAPEVTLPKVALEDTAYVMFTSGSTGQPKGVEITHANLAASNAARPIWYKETPEAFLLLSSHAFDSSVVGIYWTLSTGGALHIPDHDAARDTAGLVRTIRDAGITYLLCLPSVYDLLLDTDAGAFAAVKTVIVAGEEATSALIQHHNSSGQTARLVNEYGPTEATVWASVADLSYSRSDQPVPVGQAVPGATLFIEDADGRAVPDGLPGELIVAGPGVAKGYFDLPQETEQRFTTRAGMRAYRTGDLVRRAPDGQLTYVGRADAQVKLRGYRVELAEIETLLANRADLREAAVALHGEARLIAYVVANEDAPLSPDTLWAYCADALPDYMVPGQFVLLDALPRTPNGKVDRKALPAPAEARPQELVSAATQTESVLAELWRKVLWLDREVGVTEDFHDLGGHSLTAMRLVNEIEDTFHIRVPLSRLGRITTVVEQAKLLETLRREPETAPQARAAVGHTPSVLAGLTEQEDEQLRGLLNAWRAPPARDGFKIRVLNETGTQPPLFFCFLSEYAFTQLAEHLGPDQPVFGLRGVNSIIPVTGEEMFEDNMRRAAISYLPEVLELAGDAPVRLGGYCQGATLAMNIAALLSVLQKPVATVIAVEKSPPIAFPGHVDFVFAEGGFLNPYQQYDAPEQVWQRRYASHTFELVSGEYGTVFRPPHILQLGGVIRDRLRKANTPHLPNMPRIARSIAWNSASLPPRVAPGDALTLAVSFRNESPHVWTPTEQSGLRVRADWLDASGVSLGLPAAYGPLFDPVAPGEQRSVAVQVTVPTTPGAVTLAFDMIEEGVAQFSRMGNDRLVLSTVVSEEAPRAIASNPAPLPDAVQTTDDPIQEARALIRKGDIAGADRVLGTATQLNPESDVLLLEQARLYQGLGRHLKAFALLKRAERLRGDGLADVQATLSHFYSPRGVARGLYRWAKRQRVGD